MVEASESANHTCDSRLSGMRKSSWCANNSEASVEINDLFFRSSLVLAPWELGWVLGYVGLNDPS